MVHFGLKFESMEDIYNNDKQIRQTNWEYVTVT